jgi:hypothetical protein
MAKNTPISSQEDAVEYRIVKKDLIFVVTMSLIFLGILVGLFFWNRSTSGVDNFFSHLLKF